MGATHLFYVLSDIFFAFVNLLMPYDWHIVGVLHKYHVIPDLCFYIKFHVLNWPKNPLQLFAFEFQLEASFFQISNKQVPLIQDAKSDNLYL